MDLWQSLGGIVTARLVSADLSNALFVLEQSGVELFHVRWLDDLTAEFEFHRKDQKKLRLLTQRRGETVRFGQRGLYWTAKKLLHRKTLIVGLILLFILHCFVSTRVLFIKVEGSGTLPAKRILEHAEQCGIHFGASRAEVRSEKMKNALLHAMPELQWAGINTAGCTAVISVRVRNREEQQKTDSGVTCMVAATDGKILSCTATRGMLLCTPGQEVKAGEKLISGYTDCGLSIRADRAEGEVFAETKRQISVIAPNIFGTQHIIQHQQRKFSLIIGKKRINFYKDSGISDTSCDKMYVEKDLTLPGGFVLPLTLVTETVTYYEPFTESIEDAVLIEQMEAFAINYLQQQMIAGQILSFECDFTVDELAQLDFVGNCTEMIGRIQKEEIIAPDGK